MKYKNEACSKALMEDIEMKALFAMRSHILANEHERRYWYDGEHLLLINSPLIEMIDERIELRANQIKRHYEP